MIVDHLQDAITQVRVLQKKILEKQRFRGYSGRAKALSGTVALIIASFMAVTNYPRTITAHLFGWGVVFTFAFIMNYGALIHWFLFDKTVKRDVRKLRPTIEVFPAFFVGGILTWSLIRVGQVQLLAGMWMSIYGIMSFASRHVLPRIYWIVALFYIGCGSIYLLKSDVSFLNPWPMGVVFFIGEWLGSIILHYDDKLDFTVKK